MDQETSLIEVVHMTQVAQNERTHLREADLTGETHIPLINFGSPFASSLLKCRGSAQVALTVASQGNTL